MRPFLIFMLTALCSFSFSLSSYAQVDTSTIVILTPDKRKKVERKKYSKKSKPKDFYRHHKKLPATFEGEVIELTTSDFPLKRDYYLFDQFGEVYFDRVSGVGYSYCIIVDFKSKKSIKSFLKNVVLHKAPEAKIITYKNGNRLTDD